AEYDTWALDPRRFGPHATVEWTALKAIEDYQNEFRFHRPHEHRPAGRRVRTTPLTPLLEAAGAEFGVVNGWERALFYKPRPDFAETHSFGWCASHPIVAQEVAAVQERVGIMEVSGFTRFAAAGSGVRDWLDGLMAGRVPKRAGKVGLAYFLTEAGNVAGEVTIALLDETTAWIGSAAAAEIHDRDWFSERVPAEGGIQMTPLTETHTILVVAGPRARDVMAAAAPRTDWSAQAFPWLSVRRVHIGPVAAVAMSVSYSGELAYEIHVPLPQAEAAYRAVMAAGAAHGITHFGLHAAESMRIEKGFRHWKADLITEFDPFESGLDRFVDLGKQSFPGRAALLARRNTPPRGAFVTLRLESDRAPAHPGDCVLLGERVIGSITSAAWGHRVGENLAMAFLDPAQAPNGRAMEALPLVDVLVLGERLPARIVSPARYDPEMTRPRA
ncbi:MAG: glycine cleavage T C-terminal barrel domain-containing protein, partial [Pseudomonadota bacterium]